MSSKVYRVASGLLTGVSSSGLLNTFLSKSMLHRAPSLRWKFSACLMLMIAIAISSASDTPGQSTIPPILISQSNSTRAIALESVLFSPEPFPVNSVIPWPDTDGRTRITLFVLNLRLQPSDPLSTVTVDGEDGNHRHYTFRVEYFGPVPENEWMSAVVLRADDRLGDVGDLLIRLRYRGVSTNRVRVAFGHIGGGLPDDQGAGPTPAPPYRIEGRVTSAGIGIAGVQMNLTGSSGGSIVTDSTITGSDGSYTLFVTTTGNYSVTPSMPQNFYSFTPGAVQFDNVTSPKTGNFSAEFQPLTNPFQVLEFDGSPKSVVYTPFWQQDVNLGHFFWEFWAAPGPNAGGTYMLTDGYGGAHALLFGFANLGTGESNRYQLLGNVFDGVRYDNFFGSDQGPAVGEWGHYAVGWDGQNIVTYFDGVPVGKARFTGPRRTPGPGAGGGRLMIGGSDHNNFDGRIAQVRGYEGTNPREAVPSGVEASFAPQTLFTLGGNLLSYFFRPGPIVADLSAGYNGTGHIGFVRGTAAGILFDCGGCPPPQFVFDPTAPQFLNGSPSAPVQVPVPAAVPSGTLVFDSFSRPNSTYLFAATGGLGSTEGGVEGQQAWQSSQDQSGLKPFGILNGRGVLLGNSRHLAWVNTHSPSGNLLVSVERRAGPFYGCGYDTGLSFRVVDSENYFFAYTSENGNIDNPRVLTVGYFQNNQRTNLATGLNMPVTWTTLKVTSLATGEIRVFGDDTLIYSTNNNLNSRVGGVGLYNNSAGLGLVNRWDNFTVFEIP